MNLTVYALFIFLVLVLWGTVYQASHGLYAAQKEIFHAWIFWAGGLIPLPGLILTGAVLTLNLVVALLVRIKWSFRTTGLIFIHLGLILFLLGGFVSRQLSEESFLTLAEGEGAEFSTSSRRWELAVWSESDGKRTVSAIPVDGVRVGEVLTYKTFHFTFSVLSAFSNCRPSGNELQPLAVEPEVERNLPGLSLQMDPDGEVLNVYGGMADGVAIVSKGSVFKIQLRRRRFQLPVKLTLLDFKKVTYPGSDIPKSFASRLELTQPDGFTREVSVSMNRPLRIDEYTFYQSSYHSETGREYSTLSVVRNSGRMLPYYASLLTFLGLLWLALQLIMGGEFRREKEYGVKK